MCECAYVNTPSHAASVSSSAKVLVKGEPNVSYICSRYYRAPELIFGATDYTSSIGGCECWVWQEVVTECSH